MRYTVCAVLVMLSLTGCQAFDPVTLAAYTAAGEQHLEYTTYTAVDRMFDEDPDLSSGRGSVVVGSVEDIHDVNSSTPFGNIVSELIRTRLVQKGINVQELRVRSSVLLERQSGEMLLSRDRRALLPPPAASEFVTGTYAAGGNKVYVSLKVIDARSGRIKAASDFVATRTLDVDELLSGTRS